MVAQLGHEPALAPSALRGGGLLLQHVGEDGDLGAVFALVAVELVDEVIVERVFSAVPRQSTGPAKLLHRQAGDERHHLYVVLVVFGQRFLAALLCRSATMVALNDCPAPDSDRAWASAPSETLRMSTAVPRKARWATISLTDQIPQTPGVVHSSMGMRASVMVFAIAVRVSTALWFPSFCFVRMVRGKGFVRRCWLHHKEEAAHPSRGKRMERDRPQGGLHLAALRM